MQWGGIHVTWERCDQVTRKFWHPSSHESKKDHAYSPGCPPVREETSHLGTLWPGDEKKNSPNLAATIKIACVRPGV